MKYAEVFRWLISLYSKVPYYFLGGYAFPPMFLILQATNRCNLYCKHCYRFQSVEKETLYQQNSELTLNEIKKLVRQVSQKALIKVTGSGEPFVREDIMDILKFISSRNPCKLISNGILISERECKSLINMGSRYMFGKGLLSIAISLHGDNAIVHDEISGVLGPKYKTKNTIKRLIGIRKAKGQKYPLIELTIVILKENVSGLNGIFEWAEKVGVDSCNFVTYRKTGNYKNKMNGNDSDILYKYPPAVEFIETSLLRKQLYSLIRRAKRSNVELRFTPLNMPISEIITYYTGKINLDKYLCCDYPWLRLFIKSNGDLGICYYHTYGSIKRDSVNTAWNSKSYVNPNFRRMLKKNKIFPACYGCGYMHYVG